MSEKNVSFYAGRDEIGDPEFTPGQVVEFIAEGGYIYRGMITASMPMQNIFGGYYWRYQVKRDTDGELLYSAEPDIALMEE